MSNSPEYVQHAVIHRAKILGTYGKADRSAQYADVDRYASPEALLDAVNAQGNHIRSLQAEKERMQKQLFNLKLRNAVVVAAVTVILTRTPEIYAWLARLF